VQLHSFNLKLEGISIMKLQRFVSVVLITSILAGCTPPPQGAGQQTGGISKQDIGTVLGGIGGGVIGSTMGKGHGNTAATIGGALIGGLLGSSLGKSLDDADAMYYNRATQSALETAPAGQSLPWKNPESGNYGTVIPEAPYKQSDGRYCREYTQKVVVGGQTKSGYGTACRQPDGTWQIVK
jgi:surface antigen